MAVDPLHALKTTVHKLRMSVPPGAIGGPGSSGSPSGPTIGFGPGSAAAPSIAFSGDPDTGLYNPAPNTIGLSLAGSLSWTFAAAAATGPGVLVAAGSPSSPSLAFSTDPGSGLYSIGASNIGLSLGGTLAWNFAIGLTTYSRAGGGTFLNLTGEASTGYQAFTYGANNPINTFLRGRGTIASPSAPSLADNFGLFRYRGYAPAILGPQTTAEWRVVNKESAFNSTAAGSYTTLFHCKVGTTTLVETLRADPDTGVNWGGANVVIDANRLFIRRSFTVATLPAAPAVGAEAFVTDATATTFASTVAGGGSNKVPVYYDGAWKIG